MKAIRLIISLVLFLNFISRMAAQDSIRSVLPLEKDTVVLPNDYALKSKRLIIPAAFITYGVGAMFNHELKDLNTSTRNEVVEDKPRRISLDNYTQYMPAVMVYGLNLAGVKGKHNFGDRTIIYATSQLMTAAVVLPLKHLVREERPDHSDNLSFPSGHTATAFSSAQFLFREYKDSNLLLSLSGYPLALFTGIYRVVNNKHWIGDVATGAGIGIISTEVAYWMYPAISSIFHKKKESLSTVVLPTYLQGSYGLTLVKVF